MQFCICDCLATISKEMFVILRVLCIDSCITNASQKKQYLPSDPEFLHSYMDALDSDESDDDFDGYVDNIEIITDGEVNSSFQNYTNGTVSYCSPSATNVSCNSSISIHNPPFIPTSTFHLQTLLLPLVLTYLLTLLLHSPLLYYTYYFLSM